MHFDINYRDRAELHAHLWSSVSVEVLWDLSHDQWIRLPVDDFDDFESMITMGKDQKNKWLLEMHKKFFRWTELIQSSPMAVLEAVKSTIWLNYRKSNLVLQEIRINPMNRNKGWEMDLDNIIVSAIHWMDKALLQYSKVKAWIILCLDRRFDVKRNQIIVDKALKYKNRWIIWVDVAWPQDGWFDIKDYKEMFDKCKNNWVWVTIHAWEEGRMDELKYIVDVIKPHRIWHGIMAAKDKEIMKSLVKNDIILENCPTSNLKNSKVKDISELKSIFRTLLDNWVKLTLNTDGAVMYNINIISEEKLLLENNIITEKELDQMYKNAFDYTFIKD